MADITLKDADILRLQPGDVLVFRTPHTLDEPAMQRIQEHLGTMLKTLKVPGVRAIVCDDGATLEIIRAELVKP